MSEEIENRCIRCDEIIYPGDEPDENGDLCFSCLEIHNMMMEDFLGSDDDDD